MPKSLLFFAALALAACTNSGVGDYYDRCDGSSDCDPDLQCFTVAFEPGADGAMCTGECVDDRDCPGNGACYELVGDPMVGQRVCYERCRFIEDCPSRFTCADTLDEDGNPTGDAICLPCASSGCP